MAELKNTLPQPPAQSGPIAVYVISARWREVSGALNSPAPFYVGQSKMPRRRFATHLSRAHSDRLGQRIERHVSQGDALQFAVVQWFSTKAGADEYEQRLIRRFVRAGCCLENREAQPHGRYFMETGEDLENDAC